MNRAKAAFFRLAAFAVALFAVTASAGTVSLKSLEGRWTDTGDCSPAVAGVWTVTGDRIKFVWPTTQGVEKLTGHRGNVFDTVTISPPEEAGQLWSYEIEGDNVTIYDHQNSGQQVVTRCRSPGVASHPNATLERDQGHAPCTIGNGYQTVPFSNGAVYSGSFMNCRPLPGPAQFQQGATALNGLAEPIDDHTVRLMTENAEVIITLQIQRVIR